MEDQNNLFSKNYLKTNNISQKMDDVIPEIRITFLM